MENPSASEYLAVDRSDDVREPLRNDIRLDAEWKHQQFREGPSACEPAWPCGFPIQSLAVPASLTIAKSLSWQVLRRA